MQISTMYQEKIMAFAIDEAHYNDSTSWFLTAICTTTPRLGFEIIFNINEILCIFAWVGLFTRPFLTSGNFRAARLPGQAKRTAKPLCHSWISMVSSKHNWPEFYPGNARACPGLEPPMFLTLPFFTLPIEEGSRNQTTWAVKWNNCKEYKYTTLWTV